MNPLSGNDFENGQNTRKRLFDFFCITSSPEGMRNQEKKNAPFFP